MPDPIPFDPDDRARGRRSLSAREQSALRRIEQDLLRDDPTFTRRMRGDDHVTVALPRERRTLVIAVVVGLVLVLVVVPSSWWVLYLLLGLMALATWVMVRGPGADGPPDRTS
ncbi:DUF3040 domain-containing protein [Pseudonocardia lacus]|uniref:DUF3040 domain-containing protein n=1 Tax=Pseudonocardia lacus TaxID=2835865 RepID=UPI001BDCEFF4|nr:DUF3040 domain-containing protein [Pseudonocardia lacus]